MCEIQRVGDINKWHEVDKKTSGGGNLVTPDKFYMKIG